MTNPGALRYVRATIAYDGTDFLGFQWQANGRTVQGALEQALARVNGIPVEAAPSRVIGAGRTDAGVHAAGQVIGFMTGWRWPLEDLQRALNAVLPADVAVLALGLAEPGWHPRFSAVRRSYRYTVFNQAVRSPLERRYALHVEKPLDLAALNAGAAQLIGEHDFAAFGQPMVRNDEDGLRLSGSTVRRIDAAGWRPDGPPLGPPPGPRLVFDVTGNAFLRGMVRSMVGSLLRVGLGLWAPEQVGQVLASRNRALAAPPAAACGLCLVEVEYDHDVAWRAALSRPGA
jgi:tRNA pseudouridine38-40 synthase